MKMLSIVTFLCLLGCNTKPEQKENSTIPNEKHTTSYLTPGLDHGLLQSPINILSKDLGEGHHNITVNFSGHINKVENLGHTVQLDFEPGNTITVDEKTYEFKQIHFHTPSEHMVDGVTYPMEAHIVNVMETENETPHYLVISFLFKMGEKSYFIERFIDDIPEEAEESASVDLDFVKQTKMLKNRIDSLVAKCYHYMGSLTTPPYTETVYWLVHKEIFEASPEQIRHINTVEGDNARPAQAVNNRPIESVD